MALAGGALGVPGAALVARVTASLLFGVRSLDAWTIATVMSGTAAIALVGGSVPARRASRQDPVTALRG
jgi:putative ABC transport system permease protein